MKKIIFVFLVLLSFSTLASIKEDKLKGKWTSGCIQMQNGKNQGFVTEAYSFDKKEIKLTRTWYKSSKCSGKVSLIQNENGSFEVGKENTNNGFNPSGTYEVKFSMKDGEELGLLWAKEDYSIIRLSRGFGTQQNTMLSLTEYKKAR